MSHAKSSTVEGRTKPPDEIHRECDVTFPDCVALRGRGQLERLSRYKKTVMPREEEASPSFEMRPVQGRRSTFRAIWTKGGGDGPGCYVEPELEFFGDLREEERDRRDLHPSQGGGEGHLRGPSPVSNIPHQGGGEVHPVLTALLMGGERVPNICSDLGRRIRSPLLSDAPGEEPLRQRILMRRMLLLGRCP